MSSYVAGLLDGIDTDICSTLDPFYRLIRCLLPFHDLLHCIKDVLHHCCICCFGQADEFELDKVGRYNKSVATLTEDISITLLYLSASFSKE